jgi:amino acid permease
MDWIRSHLGIIGIALFVAALVTGAAGLMGSAASGLPFPFLITFVTILVVGIVLDRAASDAASAGRRR